MHYVGEQLHSGTKFIKSLHSGTKYIKNALHCWAIAQWDQSKKTGLCKKKEKKNHCTVGPNEWKMLFVGEHSGTKFTKSSFCWSEIFEMFRSEELFRSEYKNYRLLNLYYSYVIMVFLSTDSPRIPIGVQPGQEQLGAKISSQLTTAGYAQFIFNKKTSRPIAHRWSLLKQAQFHQFSLLFLLICSIIKQKGHLQNHGVICQRGSGSSSSQYSQY